MEIIKERLEREFDLSLLSTAPTVVYRVTKTDGEVIHIENPALLPEQYETDRRALCPCDHICACSTLSVLFSICARRREGVQKSFAYIGKDRIKVEYELPLKRDTMGFL